MSKNKAILFVKLLLISCLTAFSLFLKAEEVTSNADGLVKGDTSKNSDERMMSEDLEEEMMKGFSEKTGILPSDQKVVEEDRLHVGGGIKSQWNRYRFSEALIDEILNNPVTLNLYLDSKLKNDVRGIFKGRYIHDSTVNSPSGNASNGSGQGASTRGATGSSGSMGPTSGSTGSSSSISSVLGSSFAAARDQAVLDEMKIQFNSQRKIFWTIGVQKLKWGTGHFWNPTDFLNSEVRDFFKATDERAGLNLVKAHLPWEKTNTYLITNFEQADHSQKVGYAARTEVAFSRGEISFSHYQRKDQEQKWGSDISVALGDFDFIGETAWTSKEKQQNSVFGISYDWKYSDEDSLNLMVEGTWNETGASDQSEYPTLLLTGHFQPFQMAKAYQLFSLYFPKPGSLNQSTFQFFVIRNQIDKSRYYRGSYIWTGYEDLTLSMSVGHREGDAGSEMVFGGLFSDMSFEGEIKF